MLVPTKKLASHYDYKMDPKYRVSIPPAFRSGPDAKGPVMLQMSKEHDDLAVIKVFDLDAFEAKFQQIAEAPIPNVKKIRLEGALRMNSREAGISDQGKLTIPKDWAERIGLKAEGQVLLGGRGGYFVICTSEIFEAINRMDTELDDAGLAVL